MTQNPRNSGEPHSLLNHPCRCCMSETVKGQPVNPSVFDSRQFADSLKTSFDVGLDPEHQNGGRGGLSPQLFEGDEEVRSDWDATFGLRLSVRGSQSDDVISEVNIRPRQLKDLAQSHSCRQGAYQDRLQVFASPGASGQQSRLLGVGQRSFPSPFVSHADERVVLLEGHTEQPALSLCLPEHCANSHQFPVHRGDGSRSRGDDPILGSELDRCSQSLLFVFLKLAVGDRPKFVSPEVGDDSFQLIAFCLPGSLALDYPAILVLRGNQVALCVPGGELSKRALGVDDRARVSLQLLERLCQISLGCGLVLSGSPDGVTLPVKTDVGSAGVNLFALDNDLEFTFAHVYTFFAICLMVFSCRITEGICDSTPETAYNQGVRLFLVVSNFRGLYGAVILMLIVDLEVVGSSPTSRPKSLTKQESVAYQAVGSFVFYTLVSTFGRKYE